MAGVYLRVSYSLYRASVSILVFSGSSLSRAELLFRVRAFLVD